MILFFIIKTYIRDCKEIGKENLAVSLAERLGIYLGIVGIPTAITIIYILTHIINK